MRVLTVAAVVMVVDDEFWELSGTALLARPTCVSVSTKDEGPFSEHTTGLWFLGGMGRGGCLGREHWVGGSGAWCGT